MSGPTPCDVARKARTYPAVTWAAIGVAVCAARAYRIGTLHGPPGGRSLSRTRGAATLSRRTWSVAQRYVAARGSTVPASTLGSRCSA